MTSIQCMQSLKLKDLFKSSVSAQCLIHLKDFLIILKVRSKFSYNECLSIEVLDEPKIVHKYSASYCEAFKAKNEQKKDDAENPFLIECSIQGLQRKNFCRWWKCSFFQGSAFSILSVPNSFTLCIKLLIKYLWEAPNLK